MPTSFSIASYLDRTNLGPWATFLAQVDRVAPHLGPLDKWVETLRRPKRALIVDVPIRLDDGSIRHFEGYRVQHNTSRGPGKGGTRFHPEVTLSEVMALAGWMSVKNAAMNLPFGGAKGGVRCDPKVLSTAELERLTRRYTSEIAVVIGPTKDIPAPDVNTDARIMAWMMDTYSTLEGSTVTGIVTGKPVALGGSLGRHDATGAGVFAIGKEAGRRIGLDISKARIAIQGFGNVGGVAARLFASSGSKIIAIQDHSATLYQEEGIDIGLLMAWSERHGAIKGFAPEREIASAEFWGLPCDILIPAALEQQINELNARKIQAKMVIEAANGPTTPAADDILSERGILVVPDVIANAGGVIVSYFEWVQDFSSFFWSEQEIATRLNEIIIGAFSGVWSEAESLKVSLRTASFVVACKRILQARDLRGLYP